MFEEETYECVELERISKLNEISNSSFDRDNYNVLFLNKIYLISKNRDTRSKWSMAFDSLPLRNCTTSSTERRGRIGVNGGRGERVYNSWTCSFVKERRKRERGSESRSRHHECCWHSRPHVTSPFHVQVPRRRAVPSTRLAPPTPPRSPGCTMYTC